MLWAYGALTFILVVCTIVTMAMFKVRPHARSNAIVECSLRRLGHCARLSKLYSCQMSIAGNHPEAEGSPAIRRQRVHVCQSAHVRARRHACGYAHTCMCTCTCPCNASPAAIPSWHTWVAAAARSFHASSSAISHLCSVRERVRSCVYVCINLSEVCGLHRCEAGVYCGPT